MKLLWTLTAILGVIAAPALAQDDAATDDTKSKGAAPTGVAEQQAQEQSNEGKPDESKPDESKPDESKPDESKPDESKPDESKPDESKPDESKPEAKPAAEVPAEAPAETAPAQQPESASGELKTDKEKTSYAIGVSIGRGLKRDGADIDPALVGRGLADAFGEAQPQLSDAEIREAIIAFQDNLRREAGRRYLEANKDKEGVVTLESGLQYREIKAGDGATPKKTDTVQVHYRGTLIDGTQFDSSYDGNEPAEFVVTRVIPGWTEALQLMKVGSTWELVIPPELGYGENPRPGGKIRPGDVLVFQVELLDIVEPKDGNGQP